MAKKVLGMVKMRLMGGQATPAAPVGPALGQHGVNLMGFCKDFNAQTDSMKGQLVSVKVRIFDDKSYVILPKQQEPMVKIIKDALSLKSGSAEPNKTKVATLTDQQVTEIAEKKMADLNANDLEAAKNIVRGTARSMGIEWETPA